jgi:hypothetical protein
MKPRKNYKKEKYGFFLQFMWALGATGETSEVVSSKRRRLIFHSAKRMALPPRLQLGITALTPPRVAHIVRDSI